MTIKHQPVTESQLAAALHEKQFVLFYQPKVCLLRGVIIGSEALVRWRRSEHDLVPPDDFIPLAESSGLLGEITLQMLEQSVQAIERLRPNHPGLSVSMNVTPTDLESHNVSRQIKQYLSADRIKPDDLQIEITESLAMGDFERVYDDLLDLNRMGISVVMDDFGTGYSSIDRLSQLPFSSLKLDKGVVSRMGTSIQNLDVVKSSISMARELRMTSVAEGVESEGAYNFLLANGCEEAQGYWISVPLTLDNYAAFLQEEPSFYGSQIGRVHQALYNIIHYRKSLIDAAYCFRVSENSVLDSVIDPEVKLDASESRFGLWYYGIGQRIADCQSYNELEKPFLALHECGQRFMQSLQNGVDATALDKTITEADEHMDQLTSSLHKLERQLLFAAG